MARFLLVPWQSGGHVPVALTLARHLVKRGHDVTVLGHDGLAERVALAGCTFAPYEGVAPLRLNRDGDVEKGFRILVPYQNSFEIASNVREQAGRVSADAVVADVMAPAAFAGADSASVPAAGLASFLYTPWRDSWGKLAVQINDTRRRLGLEPIREESPAELMKGRRILVATPRIADFKPPGRWSRVRYVGPLLDPDPAPPWDSPWEKDDPRPLVLVSVSSMFRPSSTAMQTALDVLGTLGVRVLLTIGHEPEPQTLRPPENAVVRSWVPHDTVLPETSLLITNGGAGTIGVALAHGVPLLTLPLVWEQAVSSRRIEQLGAGLMLDDLSDRAEVEAAITDLLGSERYRRAAARVAKRIDRRGGERAVRELEDVARKQD